ncbi:hypothetical protein AO1008_03897 [Aspergillus oryzae 100-8]|nr:hypothetical protein AO1008_03897 [Aspergillus oryzae 100-8]
MLFSIGTNTFLNPRVMLFLKCKQSLLCIENFRKFSSALNKVITGILTPNLLGGSASSVTLTSAELWSAMFLINQPCHQKMGFYFGLSSSSFVELDY